MAAPLRRAVNSVTGMVFPPPKIAKDVQQHQLINRGQAYVTSLPLQMSLYFNAFFYPLWLITEIVCLEAKYSSLAVLYQIIVIAIAIVMTIVEVIRLYLGYVGNLTEKVPELAGFWLLTILVQTPLVLFILLNESLLILPLQRATTIILAAFVVVEVFAGYFAIRFMVNYQVTKFHLQQFTSLDGIDEMGQPAYDPHPKLA